jgi:hypothetical protein
MELSLYDMVGGDILEPGHSAHGGRLHRNSHIDQVLCKGHGFSIARYSNGAVHIAARFAVFTIRDSNHGATELSDLGNLRSSFANDAAYQLVGNRHFMGLLRRLRPILMSSQSGKGCKLDW